MPTGLSLESSNPFLSDSRNHTEQRKYGRLETVGHVGSVDNITQINTGRIYLHSLTRVALLCSTDPT
jgi:hypothetical protein